MPLRQSRLEVGHVSVDGGERVVVRERRLRKRRVFRG